MATVSAIKRESAGSNTFFRIQLTSVATGETYNSYIPSIVGFWMDATDDPTQTREKIDVSLSGSTFTFSTGNNTKTGDLCILAKC